MDWLSPFLHLPVPKLRSCSVQSDHSGRRRRTTTEASSPAWLKRGAKLNSNCFLHSVPILARRKHTIRWEASTFGVGSLPLAGELVAEAVKQLQQADPHSAIVPV
jgi:hypothetical protein